MSKPRFHQLPIRQSGRRLHTTASTMLPSLTVNMTPKGGGPPVERAGNTLSILSKRAGTWMIARDANMLAATGSG